MVSGSNEARGPAPRPDWVPPGLDYDTLGPALRRTLAEVVGPLYAELMAKSGSGWERATGLTYVRAVCLELVAAEALGASLGTTTPGDGGLGAPSESWGRYLRAVALSPGDCLQLRVCDQRNEKVWLLRTCVGVSDVPKGSIVLATHPLLLSARCHSDHRRLFAQHVPNDVDHPIDVVCGKTRMHRQ